MTMMVDEITGILNKCLIRDFKDLEGLAVERPEFFSFTGLSLEDKITLVRHNQRYLNTLNFNDKEKIELLIRSPSAKVRAKYPLTKEDLGKISDRTYTILANGKWNGYLDKDRVAALSKRFKGLLFLENSAWYIDTFNEIPKLSYEHACEFVSKRSGRIILLSRPEFFKEHKLDYWGWHQLLRSNFDDFSGYLLENLDMLPTKTDFRKLVRTYPLLISMVTVEHIQKSVLDAKEWVYLIDSVKGHKPLLDSGWTLSDEIKVELKYGLTVDILSEKSKKTKRLSNTMDILSEEKEFNEEANEEFI